jgi:hypothetical protein
MNMLGVPKYTVNSTPGRQGDRLRLHFGLQPRLRLLLGLLRVRFRIEPLSEISTTEQPLSGPATGLVISSTPAGRFVYWPDRKPADLTDGNSRYVAHLDSLPFQEGTPLSPAEEHTPTEVETTNSNLGSPDCQVFMTTNEMPGPSGTQPDRFLEDISADKLSANAPADETSDDRNARRERNRKRNERHRRLRESLPIRNLTEALNQVESRVHTTPEQCLMSILR